MFISIGLKFELRIDRTIDSDRLFVWNKKFIEQAFGDCIDNF